MRGIVTLAGVHLGANRSLNMSSDATPEEMRSWVLYWDKVSVPIFPAVRIGRSNDFEYLRSKNLVEELQVPVNDGDVHRMFLDARGALFLDKEQKMPGQWAVATPLSEEGGEASQRALRVHLAGALPVPTRDIPIDEILEFKKRRSAERAALLSFIDELYLEARNSADKPVAEQLAFRRLTEGARDHLRTVEETGWRYRLMDIAADFNIAPGAFAIAGFAASSAAMGLTLPEIVGNSLLAGATVSVSQVAGLFRGPERNSPYRYLSALREEVYGTD